MNINELNARNKKPTPISFTASEREALKKNQGWMHNIDKMDNNKGEADGWLRYDILYREFPGLSQEISGVSTKYKDGSIFFNSNEMAKYITVKYNSKPVC